MKRKSNILGSVLVSSLILGGSLILGTSTVSAHGYVATPASRGYQGKLDANTEGWTKALEMYGNVITNPQSLEAPKGYPDAGPADGKIASANGGFGQIGDFVLDKQTPDRWKKTAITTGANTFTWHYTAPHKTTKWHYYMTKPDWDQNSPLTRDKLELIDTIAHDGSTATNNLSHTITVPNNREGYNVILAVWDVADTANAFYSVIDVTVKNSDKPVSPSKPTRVKAANTTKNATSLSWDSQLSAASFDVYRNGKKLRNVTGNRYEDKGLSSGSTYNYEIVAISAEGLSSDKSDKLTVKTLNKDAQETLTPPANLHTMGETHETISLMWRKSTHSSGIKTYEIYRNGEVIAKTSKTSYKDSGLSENTKYTYAIRAISHDGTKSDFGKNLTVATKTSPPSPGKIDDYRKFSLGTLTSPQRYTANEVVSYAGKRYVALVTHNNYGDSSWNPPEARSLFKEKK